MEFHLFLRQTLFDLNESCVTNELSLGSLLYTKIISVKCPRTNFYLKDFDRKLNYLLRTKSKSIGYPRHIYFQLFVDKNIGEEVTLIGSSEEPTSESRPTAWQTLLILCERRKSFDGQNWKTVAHLNISRIEAG